MDSPANETPRPISYHKRPLIVGLGISMILLATIFVIFRFWAKSLTRNKHGADDWIAAISLFFIYGYIITSIIAAYDGAAGNHPSSTRGTTEALNESQLYLSISDIIYATTISLLKASILTMYCRIFPIRSLRIGAYTLGAIVFLWWLAVCLVSVFQCRPIRKAWSIDQSEGTCIDKGAWFLGVAIPNILTDAAILALPVQQVWQLRLSKSQKAGVMGLFLLGGCVIIISSVRTKCLLGLRGANEYQIFTEKVACVWWWSSVEISIGCVSACLPTLAPLVRLAFGQLRTCYTRSNRTSSMSSDATFIGNGQRKRPIATDLERDRYGMRFAEDEVPQSEISLPPFRSSIREGSLPSSARTELYSPREVL